MAEPLIQKLFLLNPSQYRTFNNFSILLFSREMVAQRLSIWGALRQISSMNEKNTASRRGDWWVTSFSPRRAAAAARKDAYDCQQKGSGCSTSPESPVSTLAPPPCPPLSPRSGGRKGKGFFTGSLAD